MSADDVFFWANWVLIAALVLGVAATYAIVVSGNIRDKSLKLELADRAADAAHANLQIAALNVQAVGLEESTAKANARAAEAQVALERFKAPRDLSGPQIAALRTAMAPFRGTTFEISTYPGDSETASLASKIAAALVSAGWARVPTDSQPLGLVSGVYIALNAVTSLTPAGEAVRTANPAEDNIAGNLIEALRVAGITTGFAGRNSLRVNPQRVVLQVIVGKKP